MHNATTKQRLAALRRKLGIFASTPRWVQEGRARRLARLEAALVSALPLDDAEVPVAHGGRGFFAAAIADGRPGPAPGLDGADDGRTFAAFAPARLPDLDSSEEAPAAFTSPRSRAARASGVTTVVETPASARLAADRALATTEVERRELPVPLRGGRAAALAVAVLAAAGALLVSLRPPSRPPEPVPPPAATAPAPSARAAAAVPVAPVAPLEPAPRAGAVAAEVGDLEVRPGDTLWELSARHLGAPVAWPRLHAANEAQVRDPDLIFPGQRLRLPGP